MLLLKVALNTHIPKPNPTACPTLFCNKIIRRQSLVWHQVVFSMFLICFVFGKMLIRACVTVLLDIKNKFEDTKGVVRSRTSKENRQYNGQKKKDKQ